MSEVIYYSSDETGAPTLNNAAGALVAVLDACLINGFNSKSVTIVVSSGIATMTASAHGWLLNRKLLVAGATTTAINGVKKILSVPSANTVTFDATGVADGTIAGTITAKRAPLGWTKPFSGTNQAMYQRTDPSATASLLRIDDAAGGTTAITNMVETATDFNTFTGAAAGTGYSWSKGANSAAPQGWILIGDGTALHLFCDSAASAGANGMQAYTFGDLISFRPGDAYHCTFGGSTSGSIQLWHRATSWAAPDAAFLVQRGSSQFGVVQALAVMGAPGGATFGDTSNPAFPSNVDGGLVFQGNVIVAENGAIRGYVRGLKEPLCSVPATLHKAEMTGIHGTSSTYLVVRLSGAGAGNGGCGIDITGPWV